MIRISYELKIQSNVLENEGTFIFFVYKAKSKWFTLYNINSNDQVTINDLHIWRHCKLLASIEWLIGCYVYTTVNVYLVDSMVENTIAKQSLVNLYVYSDPELIYRNAIKIVIGKITNNALVFLKLSNDVWFSLFYCSYFLFKFTRKTVI